MKPVSFTKSGLEQFGLKLKKYRKDRGWSLRESAAQIGNSVETNLSASTLGDLERAAVVVKADTLLLLSQVGYGGMTFSEMVDILTDRRLALCELGATYEA